MLLYIIYNSGLFLIKVIIYFSTRLQITIFFVLKQILKTKFSERIYNIRNSFWESRHLLFFALVSFFLMQISFHFVLSSLLVLPGDIYRREQSHIFLFDFKLPKYIRRCSIALELWEKSDEVAVTVYKIQDIKFFGAF